MEEPYFSVVNYVDIWTLILDLIWLYVPKGWWHVKNIIEFLNWKGTFAAVTVTTQIEPIIFPIALSFQTASSLIDEIAYLSCIENILTVLQWLS